MSAIDILIVIVFFGAVGYGFWKGIIVQLGSLTGILLGILACRLFGPWFTGIIGQVTGSSDSMHMAYVNGIVANIILFICGFVVAKLTARLVKMMTNAVKLTLLDKLAGVLFTLFEWFLVMSILLNLWQVMRPGLDVTASSKMGNGRAARAVLDLAPVVFDTVSATTIFDSMKNNDSHGQRQ